MEKLSYRDQVLIGNPSSSPLAYRTSNVDFSDVFGGPPKCSSRETRHSVGEVVDSFSFRRGEETQPVRNSWSCLSEKPVFGTESPRRRRQIYGDFFDDIFMGSEDPQSSNNRKNDIDPFSSMPVSQNSSPTRHFATKLERPAQPSLSSRVAKAIDYSTLSTPCRSPVLNKESSANTFASPSLPRSGMTSISNETKIGQDHSTRYDLRTSYRQSPLSHEYSVVSDGSLKDSESAVHETGSQSSKNIISSETSSDASQFHFSIYKWASKGVTLMMSSKGGKRLLSKQRSTNGSIVSGLPSPYLKGIKPSSSYGNISAFSSSLHSQYDNRNSSSTQDLSKLTKDDVVERATPSKPEPKPLYSFMRNSTKEDEHDNQNVGLTQELGTLIKDDVVEKAMPFKPEAKPLHSFLEKYSEEEIQSRPNLNCQPSYFSDEPGKETVKPAEEDVIIPKVSNLSAENVNGSVKLKKQIGGKLVLNHDKVTSPRPESENNLEKKMQGNKVKGKVKEFVKIFNREASPTLRSNADGLGQSNRRKDWRALKVDEPMSYSTTEADHKEMTNDMQHRKESTDIPFTVDYILKERNVSKDNINACTVHSSSSELKGKSASHPEPDQAGFQEVVSSLQGFHGDTVHVNCVGEELPNKQDRNQPLDQIQDDIKASDAKIQRWSQGKEGNIRSLLSTLQYVLWSESGWKPVPLVDIIEGPSVKRAYQKAMLCLHPDKLQQKGAAVHQKYIAAKVFEILQEAWDHFSSLSSV